MYIQAMPRRSPLDKKIDRIAGECLGMRARRVDRAVSAIYNELFAELGVKLSQLNVLIAVGKLEPARPAEVARGLALESSTLSRNADRLRARGYLDVLQGEDARSVRYQLTAAGRELIQDAYPLWVEAQRRVRDLLGSSGADALLAFSPTARD